MYLFFHLLVCMCTVEVCSLDVTLQTNIQLKYRISKDNTSDRVPTGQGKVREVSVFFKVSEKSVNFEKWSEKIKKDFKKPENF